MPDDFALGDGGFAKIYGDRLADSSLLECAVATRWCFLYMLARADSEGRFRCATVRGLTGAAAVTLEEAEHAIAELEAPDPDSTTPDEGGRRIVRIPGGWRIVAKAKYRDFRTRRQIDAAQRQRERRERLGGESTTGERDMSRVSHDVTVTCTPEARGQRTTDLSINQSGRRFRERSTARRASRTSERSWRWSGSSRKRPARIRTRS